MSERDKFLHLSFGNCTFTPSAEFGHICQDCELDVLSHNLRSFSTWEGLGVLIEFLDDAMSDQEIADTLYKLAIDGCIQNLPDKAANYVYDLLKGNIP